MSNASLQLVENLCGCGNYQEMNAQELITNDVSTEAKRLSAMSPFVAYIQPTVEVVKTAANNMKLIWISRSTNQLSLPTL